MARLLVVLALLLAASVVWAAEPGQAPGPGPGTNPSCPALAQPGQPQAVMVGIYVNQITSIDIKNNNFLADFYLWFRWQDALWSLRRLAPPAARRGSSSSEVIRCGPSTCTARPSSWPCGLS